MEDREVEMMLQVSLTDYLKLAQDGPRACCAAQWWSPASEGLRCVRKRSERINVGFGESSNYSNEVILSCWQRKSGYVICVASTGAVIVPDKSLLLVFTRQSRLP